MSMEQLAQEYGETIQALTQREALLRRRLKAEGPQEQLLHRRETLQEELRDLRRIQRHLQQYLRRQAPHV